MTQHQPSEQRAAIAPVMIRNGRGNALKAPIRTEIAEAVMSADADPDVSAIVLFGAGTCFASGVDLGEPGGSQNAPDLATLCQIVDSCKKPVIAALHGLASGCGLELALAAHYRVALPGTVLSQPDISFGRIPSAGATQRLPRIAGVGVAARMLLDALPVKAEVAYRCGLVDAVLDHDDPVAAAQEFFKTGMEARPSSKRAVRPTQSKAFFAAIEKVKRQLADNVFAPQAKHDILLCLENSALVPFDTGMRMEARFAETARQSPEARALHYVQKVRAAAGQGFRPKDRRRVSRLGISGLSETGLRLITKALRAGLHVILVEPDRAALNAAIDRIGDYYQRAVDAGKMAEAEAVALLSSLRPTERLEELARCDLVLDALPELASERAERWQMLEEIAPPEAVLACLSRHEDPGTLPRDDKSAARVFGLSFTQTAPHRALAEISATPEAGTEARLVLGSLVRRLDLTPVGVAAQPGRIVDAILADLSHMAHLLLRRGATVAQIDASMRVFGFHEGIFQMLDRIGLDRAALAERNMARPEGWTRNAIAARLRRDGHLGLSSGRGYYRYDHANSAKPELNPDLQAMIDIDRSRSGTPQHKFRERDIRLRLLGAMANRAALLFEAGLVARASDIDAAVIAGLGFPADKGGIVWQVDEIGAYHMVRQINGFVAEDTLFWQVAPVLHMLARERGRFTKLVRT